MIMLAKLSIDIKMFYVLDYDHEFHSNAGF